ncbi:MAG: toprim domain-containing protein, partial [Halodesulfovibrio sp.]
MKCSRANNCGWEEPVRELLPELFENFVDRYPPTETEPDRTANVYMGMNRGFDLSKIRGWYEQGTYQYPRPHSSYFTPTVRFYLDRENNVYWDRLIKPLKSAENKGKARFHGEYKGMVWTPPGMEICKGDRVFLVEGIFHAIALFHAGIKAGAALSSSNFPDTFIEGHKDKNVRWVLALDGDKAGSDYTKRHAEKLQAMGERFEVCRLSGKQDWDDLYRAGKITDAFISDCLYYGRLFMAESVDEKAYHWYCRNRGTSYQIDFENALYAIKVSEKLAEDLLKGYMQDKEDTEQVSLPVKEDGDGDDAQPETEAEDKAKSEQVERDDVMFGAFLRSAKGRDLFFQHSKVERICNVRPEFLYRERDEIMDEQWYVFRVNYPAMPPDIIKLEGSHIASPDAFHKALLNNAGGGTFHGTPVHFKCLTDKWLDAGQVQVVKSVPYVGYVPELKTYVFQQHAFNEGREIPLNNDGYFQVRRGGIKSNLRGLNISTQGEFSPKWLDNYAKAFHWQGLTVLAFWLGSLFVQQIRNEHKTFPFLEYTGEPGAGKSTVLEFLWKCSGRDDYEGFDIMKATTAGRRRAFNQVSNLPVVLIESDRDTGDPDAKAKQFDFDTCKPFYNGRGTGTLGVAKRGNEIDESLFQASLIISQNAEVDGSEAHMQRIVHCHADKSHHQPGTREIARWFERQSSETVGGFLREALKNEQKILETYCAAFAEIEGRFTPELKNERLVKNHAQVAACGHALKVLFPKIQMESLDRLTDYILERAKIRERRIAADHPIVEQFWDTFHYLNEECRTRMEPGWLNHSCDEGLIGI